MTVVDINNDLLKNINWFLDNLREDSNSNIIHENLNIYLSLASLFTTQF